MQGDGIYVVARSDIECVTGRIEEEVAAARALEEEDARHHRVSQQLFGRELQGALDEAVNQQFVPRRVDPGNPVVVDAEMEAARGDEAALVRDRGIGGALVTEIDAESPAHKAGIEIADVILSLDGMIVESPEEMLQVLDSYTPDNQIRIHLLRGIQEIDVYVDLDPIPENYGVVYAANVFGFDVRDSQAGVVINKVISGSPADSARVRSGDRLAEIDGVEILTVEGYEQVFLDRIGVMPLQFLIVRGNRGYYINLP